ncbi:hypothetical protein ACSIJM_23965, partial [Vibrio parahaemolyticus]
GLPFGFPHQPVTQGKPWSGTGYGMMLKLAYVATARTRLVKPKVFSIEFAETISFSARNAEKTAGAIRNGTT